MAETRILIIDDTTNIRKTLQIALARPDWSIEGAGDGEEGLALLETGRFRLALLDLNLPGMHGMDVLRRIRKNRPEVAIIIITAYGTVEYSVEALKLGAVDFLAKPFTPSQIRTLVMQALSRPALKSVPPPDDPIVLVDYAKNDIHEGNFESARLHLKRANELSPTNPITLNLLGAVIEITGNRLEAQTYYRAALSFDPTYSPARQNLERSVFHNGSGDVVLGK